MQIMNRSARGFALDSRGDSHCGNLYGYRERCTSRIRCVIALYSLTKLGTWPSSSRGNVRAPDLSAHPVCAQGFEPAECGVLTTQCVCERILFLTFAARFSGNSEEAKTMSATFNLSIADPLVLSISNPVEVYFDGSKFRMNDDEYFISVSSIATSS